MLLNTLFYAKQFLTFFLKQQKNSISCNLNICRSNIAKKMDFRLKKDIAAIRNNCVITTFNKKQCGRGTITTQTKALVEKFRYNWALKGECHAHAKIRSKFG